MNKVLILLLTTLSCASYANDASFGDPNLGKVKSPSCVFCHGATGASSNPSYPNLNSQNALYLYNAMKDYQLGNRQGPLAEMMKAQLSRLNEEDLKDIAAFYAEQK